MDEEEEEEEEAERRRRPRRVVVVVASVVVSVDEANPGSEVNRQTRRRRVHFQNQRLKQ